MNRTLDISNYEEWFIDHLDGTLSAEEDSQLSAFLLSHPDLAAELEAMDEVQLEAKDIAFPDKSALLIPSEEELKLMMIAEEGGLAEMQSLSTSERDEIAALESQRTNSAIVNEAKKHDRQISNSSFKDMSCW